MKEMDENQIKNKYLQGTNIKLKNFLKKIDIDVDIPTQNCLHIFKWIAKKAIWAAILLLFSVLTTIGCSDLLLQYVNGVTTTKIEVSKSGSVPFPSSTVCLPLYEIAINMFDEHVTIENASQYLHAEVSEYFENPEHHKETFLNGSLWSPAMLFVALGYVTGLHTGENYEWTMDTTTNFSEYKIKLQGKVWWEAAITLEKEISMVNISISELTEAVGQAFAMKFNLRVTHYTAYDGLIHPSYFSYNTSYIGARWICYNVDFSGLAITSQDELIVVDFYVSSDTTLNERVLSNEQYVVLFAPSANFYMDLKTLIAENADDDNNLPLLVMTDYRLRKNYYLGIIGYDSYISYDLVQMYRFMTIINGRQQCSEVQSMEVCRAECRASQIKNLCNCTATSLTTPPEDMSSECTLSIYGNCSLEDVDNDSMCDCLKPCTRWDYEIKQLATYSSYPNDSGSIIIRLAKLDYRVFEQTYLWSMEGFIGAFGGALSLWLGIDFLMAFNFFSVIVAKLIKICVKSKQPSNSNAVINQGHTYLKEKGDTHKENPAVGKKEIEKITADELLTIKAFKPSNWSCFKVLSFIVNLIFSLATIIMCIRLFQQYFSDPPIIEMSAPYDAAFELPKLTEIVLPMYKIDLELNINKTLYGEKVDEYFGQQMNKEAFLSRTDAWPPEIFALCLSYLAYLSAVEGIDLDYWNIDTTSFSDPAYFWNDIFLKKVYSGELYDAAFQLEKKLSQMEVTVKELKLSVAEKLKSAFQLSVKYVYAVDGIVTKENVSVIENTCINEARLCFKADFSNKSVRRPGEYIEISSRINQSILPIDNTNDSPPLLIVDFNGQIMTDIFNYDDDIVNMVGRYGFSTIYKVFTLDAYRKIPSIEGETKCINYEKKDQCRWQCRSEMIYKKCKCTAISLPLPNLPPGPECSFSIYNTYLQYSKQDDMQCIKQCLEPCEKWKYQVDMEKRVLLKKENEAIIQMQVKKFDYVMYTEKLPWTYETFAGAIGGVLGLWLGLDFVIMIGAVSELIGYILTRLFHTIGLKKINAGATVPDRIQSNEASKKNREESIKPSSSSAIMTWSKKSFKILIKALYSMKLGVILKLIVVKTFWGYLIVLFCFLTFRMCLLSTRQYLKNPTTTNMQFILNNTFIMPTSTLCVPVSRFSLGVMLGSPNTAHYESMMMEYFAQNQENKEAFLNANDKKWPLEVYAVIYVHLSTFGRAEGFSLDSNDPCPIDLTSSRLCSTSFPLWENEWKAVFFKLETILKRMIVSRSELLQSFGQQTLKIYNISILYVAEEDKKLIKSPIELSETSSVDSDYGVCVRINFSGTQIRSEAELLNISIDSNGLHDIYTYYAITFDMNGRYKPETKINTIIFGVFGITRTYVISAKEFDQIFPGNKEDPDCNENVSPEICRSECRASLIRRLCNCTAASLPIGEVPNLSDECTLAAYQNCLKYNAANDFECRKYCSRSCKRETYQWKFNDYYDSGNANVANLILTVEDFGYAIFEEEYEWTFERFLGEFGGNLGLWIGLDIKMVLGEIFSIVFVIGKQVMAFISAKIAGNAVIVI